MPGEPAGLWNKNLILNFPKDFFFKETNRNNQEKKKKKENKPKKQTTIQMFTV